MVGDRTNQACGQSAVLGLMAIFRPELLIQDLVDGFDFRLSIGIGEPLLVRIVPGTVGI